ncbi:acyl-CoA thioesterase [Rhodopirellula baltica]|uniref:acyl-CoA thioesterase n=1 Tax=Rhodopirellula baltica TaxID=265606 RepID=UPI001F2B6625|nr:thioesterase family protein [Rhodopirellula baltica]
MVHIDCRYRASARYDDEIDIVTRIAKITAAKIIHEYEIRRGDEVLVQATVTLAVIDKNGRLQRVPEALLT